MLALIPLPYRILGALLLALSMFASGVWYGTTTTNDSRDADELTAERAATKKYKEQVDRGNDLSAKLSVAESTIQIKTSERIKHVPQVTTGKPCLSPAAVDLVNGVSRPAASPALSGSTGQSFAESSRALAASDADIATWAVEAGQYYDTCAARLNTLIDYVVPSAKDAAGEEVQGARIMGNQPAEVGRVPDYPVAAILLNPLIDSDNRMAP